MVNSDRFISYLRVSTDRQGQSGLGLEAQRASVAAYLRARGQLVAEFIEIESGRRDDRPQLATALAQCRLQRCVLVVAKVDRLARNVRFLLTLVHEAGERGVAFCDLPDLPPGPVGRFMLTQMAAVAELEAGLISQRTKAALSAAKVRGVKLGGFRGHVIDQRLAAAGRTAAADDYAKRVGPVAASLRGQGKSLRQIAEQLSRDGIRTPHDTQWTAAAVRNVLARSEGLSS